MLDAPRRRHHLAHQAHRLRLARGHRPAGEQHLHGIELAHRAHQPLRAADAGHDADADLGLGETRALAGDDDVAVHRQLGAAAEGIAADGSDHRLGAVLDRRPHALGVALRISIGPASSRLLMSPPAANTLSPPVSTMQRTLVVGAECREGLRECGLQRQAERVGRLGAVHAQQRHAFARAFDDQFGRASGVGSAARSPGETGWRRAHDARCSSPCQGIVLLDVGRRRWRCIDCPSSCRAARARPRVSSSSPAAPRVSAAASPRFPGRGRPVVVCARQQPENAARGRRPQRRVRGLRREGHRLGEGLVAGVVARHGRSTCWSTTPAAALRRAATASPRFHESVDASEPAGAIEPGAGRQRPDAAAARAVA
jgi:hypothetical protein